MRIDYELSETIVNLFHIAGQQSFPEIQEISRADLLSTVMLQPEPSNLNRNLYSSLYYTRSNYRLRKLDFCPEPTRRSGAAWLAEREDSALSFSKRVGTTLRVMEKNIYSEQVILKSWELQENRNVVLCARCSFSVFHREYQPVCYQAKARLKAFDSLLTTTQPTTFAIPPKDRNNASNKQHH